MTQPPNQRNTELLTASDAILHEYQRASKDGVTISQARIPHDTFLAGYLSALAVAGTLVRTTNTEDF